MKYLSVWASICVLTCVLGVRAQATGSGEPAGTAPSTIAATAAAETADEIVSRSLETNTLRLQQGIAQIAFDIHGADGSSRTRRIEVRGLEQDGLFRALVRVLAPADMAGQSYLFAENAERESDIWIYLPALESEPRRISGSQKSQAFLGSHVTYADLEGREIREGTHTRLSDEEIGGHAVFVVETVPAGSQYASIRQWIRQSDFVPLRIRFFGDGGEVVKTLFTEVVDEQQGRTYAQRMALVDATGASTTVLVERIDFEAVVEAAELTLENLAR